MLTPERLLRLIIEFVFVLLGGLVAWLGLSGRIFFDRRGTAWILLGAVLIFWGLRAIYKPSKSWARGEDWTRGLSLALLGALMLMMTRVPFAWVGPMLAAGGILLALRGIIGSALILRPR
jgi:sulfite exporter TauE/SafE